MCPSFFTTFSDLFAVPSDFFTIREEVYVCIQIYIQTDHIRIKILKGEGGREEGGKDHILSSFNTEKIFMKLMNDK